MSLFWQEHKKLWRSGMTRVAVCGLMLLTLGLQIWAMQCVNFGTMRADGSHQVNGYENIRKCQQYAAQWQTLTDETAQDMVHTYQQILAENPDFDGALADFSFLQGTLVSFLWPEVEDQTQTYPTLTIYYVDPARLTGLYERREEKLEYYLENQFSDRNWGLGPDGLACSCGPGSDLCVCRRKTAGHGYIAGNIPAWKSRTGRGKTPVWPCICRGNFCDVCSGHGSCSGHLAGI